MEPSQNPLVVFISSVQNVSVDDLDLERQATIAQIRELQLTRPWAFEETPASSDSAESTYLDNVAACDIFIIIIGKELTDAVEAEWRRASVLGKPRLAFLKRDEARSGRVTQWVSEIDVKYDRFASADDLRQRVKAAVIDEIIKGYRHYRIQDADYAVLAKTIRSSPVSFVVRTILPQELEVVSGDFPQLAELYPKLEEWMGRKRAELVNARAEAYVATYEGRNAGFALTTEKDEGVRKLSTLLVLPEFQGLGVGPRLLFDVLNKAAKDRCEKLYVTVSEERRVDLEPLLHHYGFYVEGVSGRRYRSGSWEWVWGKRLVHGVLAVGQLRAFAQRVMFEERGYETRLVGENAFLARARVSALGTPSAQERVYMVVANPEEPVNEAYTRAAGLSDAFGCSLVFLSPNRPEGVRSSDLCFDAYDLETMFFPIFIRRPVKGLVLSIREQFVRELIPSTQQGQFFAPTRTQLRTDNVYYRTAKLYQQLTRGSPLFFYKTQRTAGSSQLIGEAKLEDSKVDEPRELFARYGNLGVYTLHDLEVTGRSVHGKNAGKVLALKFDWYREFERPLTITGVRAILPTYNAITARQIDGDQAIELRGAAGWNVTELSFR